MCVLCGQDFVARVHWTDRHVEDRARAAVPGFDPVEFQGDRTEGEGCDDPGPHVAAAEGQVEGIPEYSTQAHDLE